jgi:tryptophan synthase alpha chain
MPSTPEPFNRSSPRLDVRLAALKKSGCGGLAAYVVVGDPDAETSLEIVNRLPEAGVDLIELGIPFNDPIADGPTIVAGHDRALAAGATSETVLQLVERFRKRDDRTPIVLMGYFNSLYRRGLGPFLRRIASSGADGVLAVDINLAHWDELGPYAAEAHLANVMIVSPGTSAARRREIMKRSTGFCYYASVAGTTGSKAIDLQSMRRAVRSMRRASEIPVGVGFGITNAHQVARVTDVADLAIVGAAIVKRVGEASTDGRGRAEIVEETIGFVKKLAAGKMLPKSV